MDKLFKIHIRSKSLRKIFPKTLLNKTYFNGVFSLALMYRLSLMGITLLKVEDNIRIHFRSSLNKLNEIFEASTFFRNLFQL